MFKFRLALIYLIIFFENFALIDYVIHNNYDRLFTTMVHMFYKVIMYEAEFQVINYTTALRKLTVSAIGSVSKTCARKRQRVSRYDH